MRSLQVYRTEQVLFVLALTLFLQICLHPRRLHSHHRVHFSHRHAGGHAQKVPQPHLLHPLLSKPFHSVALAGHSCGVPGHSAVHRGVEEYDSYEKEGKEGRVKQAEKNWPWCLKGTNVVFFAHLKELIQLSWFCFCFLLLTND